MGLHPHVAALAPLLGEWTGEGTGIYPTIKDFAYRERAVFSHAGKPFLFYIQHTQNPETGMPMHTETAYLRGLGDDRFEWVSALPTGHTETAVGTLTREDGTLVLTFDSQVHQTPGAKDVSAIHRTMRFEGDRFDYTLDMEAVGQSMGRHLTASLQRAEPH